MRLRFPAWLGAILVVGSALCSHGVAADGAPVQVEYGRPIVQAYAPQVFSAGSQNWSVAEDNNGVVFFGNTPGVVSFDGATWRHVRSDHFTPVTRAVALGPDGRIYAGSRGDLGWLKPTSVGGYEYVSLLDQVPEAERNFQEVFQITTHGDGVFFSCDGRLLMWRGGRFTTFPHAVTRLDSAGGELYVHSANQPLERIAGDKLVRVSDDPVFLRDQVRYIGPAADGQLFVALSKSGLFRLDPASGTLTPWATALDPLLRTKQIYRALRLADSTYAVAFTAATGGGLVLLRADGGFLNYLDGANGLPNSLVYGMGASRTGGLWLCLDYGVAYLDWPAGVTQFDQGNGLDRGLVNAVVRHHGTLYVGNTQGAYRLVPGVAPQAGAHFERMTTGGIYAFHVEGDELFAVADHKILQLTPQGFTTVFALPSLAYTMIRSRRDPAVRWIGQDNGLRALRETPQGWRDEGLVPKLNGTARNIAEDTDGSIWVAIDSQGFFHVTLAEPPGAGSPAATAKVEKILAPDEEKVKSTRARLGEWGGSIYFVVGNTQTFLRYDATSNRLAPRTDLPTVPEIDGINTVSQARENPTQFWFLTLPQDERPSRIGASVKRFAQGKLTALPHRIFDYAGNMSVLHEEPSTGVLWIGGSESLLRVEIARAFREPEKFAPLVRTRDLEANEVLPFTRNALSFDHVAMHAPTAGALEYRTRLNGFESTWSEWSPDLKRSFTNLSEGRYRYEVQARNVEYTVSEPTAIAFRILPPWWRTWWAYGGYVFVFSGSILGFARLRTRALRRRNEQLEKLIAVRTDDLRRQNTELARLHKLELDEKISARLAAEKAQLDMLRYQLNPHFLFNSLTSIRSEIPPAMDSARATIDRLADFCRLTLHGRKPDERTTVGEEVAMLRAYLDIEQTRLGELLSVAYDIDPALDDAKIPRLLLLPLVENALKYGHATSVDTLGLRIAAHCGATDGSMVFEIANTGTWVERGSRPGIPSTGIGHENLLERVRRHYPDAYSFTHREVDGWVCVRLELGSPRPAA